MRRAGSLWHKRAGASKQQHYEALDQLESWIYLHQGKFGMYGRISHLRPWIEQEMNKLEPPRYCESGPDAEGLDSHSHDNIHLHIHYS